MWYSVNLCLQFDDFNTNLTSGMWIPSLASERLSVKREYTLNGMPVA